MMARAAEAFGPLAIGVGRLLGGAFVLAVYWAWTREPVSVSKREWWNITLVAIVANSWPFTVLAYILANAEEHGFFGMLVTLVPLVTIITAVPMLNIWPTPRQLFGVVGGLICLGGVMIDGNQRGIEWGLLLLGLTVPVTYAWGNTYIKWKLEHLPPLPLTVLFLGIGGSVMVPLLFSPTILEALNLQGPEEPRNWLIASASLVLLAIFSTGICILMFIQLIKLHGPLFAGMVTYVIPLVALAWGLFDGEKLTGLQIAAMAGVLAMVALVQWRSTAKKQQQLPEPLLE